MSLCTGKSYRIYSFFKKNIMKNIRGLLLIILSISLAVFFYQCEDSLGFDTEIPYAEIELRGNGNGNGNGNGGGGGHVDDNYGNNLSFPVIFAKGNKLLRGAPAMVPILDGEWYYVWGSDPAEPTDIVNSCLPLLDEFNEPVGVACADGSMPWGDAIPTKAFAQNDLYNEWQAYNLEYTDNTPVNINYIDWGDNLESVDWTINSQVRTEVILYKILSQNQLRYSMRHISGWGANEMHGLETDLENNASIIPHDQASVFTENARLTIQKLNVERTDPLVENLIWDSEFYKWIEDEGVEEDLINDPIYNSVVKESGDGKENYDAEINIKGKLIYGYTWNVRKNNEGAGDYRITFSMDDSYGPNAENNTFFLEGITSIQLPEEEIELLSSSEPSGASAVIDFDNNLTYIDVRIVSKNKGNGKS